MPNNRNPNDPNEPGEFIGSDITVTFGNGVATSTVVTTDETAELRWAINNLQNYILQGTYTASNVGWSVAENPEGEQNIHLTKEVKTVKTKKDMTKNTPETIVTNEFIEQYFQSKDWVNRLHKNLEQCTYDGFRFETPPEARQGMLKNGPHEIHVNKLLNVVQSSKQFAGKQYDNAFVKKCLVDFMARNDFKQVEEPKYLAERVTGNFYNQYHTVEAIVGYEKPVDGVVKTVTKMVPSNYIQACPCCTKVQMHADWMPNRRQTFQLSNSAHIRFVTKLNETNPRLQVPVHNEQVIYVRDYISRYVCEPCTKDTTKEWLNCANCGRYEQRSFTCEFNFGGRRPQINCQKCFEDQMRNHMFVTNELEFQPASLEMNSRMRYVGCEFECYVKPNKVPTFDKRYVYQIKHDGSLSTPGRGIAVEVVSQPLLDWREEGIRAICKELANINVSVDTTCGGHIHVDSRGLNMNRTNMMRMRNLFRIYENAFFAVCSKDRLNNSRYCAPVPLDNQAGPQDNRYVSLNMVSLSSHNTIEFRCFDGSVDAEEWLARIAFAEGFINFAKDSLNQMIETTDAGVLSPLSKDGGYDSWNNVLDAYSYNRLRSMKELIDKNGAALINLAGCRFKLKPSIIGSLVKQHEKSWKA